MKCLICGHEEPDARDEHDPHSLDVNRFAEQFLDHMHSRHPEQYEPPQRWPDGGLVVTDETLTPEDFA